MPSRTLFSARFFGTVVLMTLMSACDSEPRVASTLTSDGPVTFTSEVNATIATPAPAVIVADQRGRGLGGVLVRWQVTSGGGRSFNDTIRTDGSGIASAGGWQLGTRTGSQMLTATVEGLAPIAFTASVSPGPPFVMARRAPATQTTVVNTLVAEPPAVTVLDAFDNLIPNATVTFSVLGGGGSIIGTTQRLTDASGVASIDGWRIGTRTDVPQILTAQTVGLATPVQFRATPIAETAVLIEAASPLQQDGVPGIGVSLRPTVRARDQYGNPAGGVTITFQPGTASGSVTGSTRATNTPEGIARVGTWVLGDAAQQTLIARSPQFPSDSFVFRANAVPSVFFIDVRFINGEPSSRNLLAVERAIARWRNVIAGQLTPARVVAGANACGPGVPQIDDVISNVRMYVNFDSIDGPGAILGRAGPCFVRTEGGLPVVGFVELDTADLNNLNNNGTLDDVMAHEFGHVLGLQSFNWNRRGLINGLGSADPIFQGAEGRAAFAAIGGGTYTGTPVPLENTGGQGTRDSHWRINVLRRELMVGFAQPGGMPLSRLSVGALADLGYQVRLDNSEEFTVPAFGTSAFGAMVMPGANVVMYGNDEWPSPIWSVDRQGRKTLVRDSDWRVTRGGGRGGGR
jgi:hypothetical protein